MIKNEGVVKEDEEGTNNKYNIVETGTSLIILPVVWFVWHNSGGDGS